MVSLLHGLASALQSNTGLIELNSLSQFVSICDYELHP